MGYGKIVGVSISGYTIILTVETDLKLLEGGAASNIQLTVSRDEWIVWKTDNPTGTIGDLIVEKLMKEYAILEKVILIGRNLPEVEFEW